MGLWVAHTAHADGLWGLRGFGRSPPLSEISLAPGKHVIEIRNRHFSPYRQTVVLEAATLLEIKYRFR